MSDREGHDHKAVVYKSHFPATKALHSYSVVTETPADTLAIKPRLLQRPRSLLFMPHDTLQVINNTSRNPILNVITQMPFFLSWAGMQWFWIRLTMRDNWLMASDGKGLLLVTLMVVFCFYGNL